MSTADGAMQPVTPSEKRWDFSADAVTPGRLVAWGGELACAAALIAPLADIPWEAGATAGIIATTASVWYEKAAGAWRRVIAARAASWLTSTGWLSYALIKEPDLMTMTVGVLVWGAGAAVNLGADRWGETTAAAEKALDERLEKADTIEKTTGSMAALLESVWGIEGVTVDPIVARWPSGVGKTVKVTLPPGNTVHDVTGTEATLAGKLHLPKGGGVTYSSGGSGEARNTVYIAITEKNMMSAAVPYPSLEPSTINKRVGTGILGNGEELGLNLKDEGFIAVGAQGSGKTALMKGLGIGLVRCVDVIIIDLDTSAKMSAVFVNPWLRYGIGRPLIDWVATTDYEQRVAVQAVRDAIAARKTEYADLLEDEDVDNLPARPDLPAIHVRVDETKSMSDDVLEGLDFIIEEGRSVNCRVSVTGLRPTRGYITATMDELTPGRIGLRTNNMSELSMLFPDAAPPDPEIFTDPGVCAVMSATKGPFEPTPVKAYATMAEAFEEGSEEYQRMQSLFMDAARELSPTRPDMDEVTARAMGPAWGERWARTIPHLRGDAHGNVGPDRMHETVWEMYQSWPNPISYAELLGLLVDDEGNPIERVRDGGTAAAIPRQPLMDDEAIEQAARQEAAIELAKAAPKPKNNDDLAVEIFTNYGRPAKPSEIYPLMVQAGYDKSNRTFRDLVSLLSVKNRLIKNDDGTYTAPEGSEHAEGGAAPGPEGPDDDGDGDRHSTDG